MKPAVIVLVVATLAACGGARSKAPPPAPTAETAPSLRGANAMVFPVQEGTVPSSDAAAQHWPVERAALDAEIAYWLPQAAPRSKWLLPEAIDRAIARSPGLAINPRALAVGSFQRAQVKRIGDPLFGDLYRLAAVLDANVAVVPVAAEYIGVDPREAVLTIAAAVINPQDGTVIWFGIIAGSEKGVDSQGAVASAAQAFARAFADRPAGGK